MAGGEDVGYHDSDVANQGGQYSTEGVDIGATNDPDADYYVGWTETAEWVQYRVSLVKNTLVDIHFRVASEWQQGAIHLELDGNVLTDSIPIPVTGDWHTWQTINIFGITLPSGTHSLRIVVDAPGFNLNYIDIVESGTADVSACNNYSQPVKTGQLPSALNEASGIVMSSYSNEQFWGHNDSGDSARLYGFNSAGTLLATLSLADPFAFDWEDIARGKCSAQNNLQSCLFVGDIGDNAKVRGNIKIHRIPEQNPLSGNQVITSYSSMTAVYEDGPHNAEALVIDENNDLIILTKSTSKHFNVYRAAFDSSQTGTFRLVGDVDLSSLPNDTQITGADYQIDNKRLIVRTYSYVLEFELTANQTLDDLALVQWRQLPAAIEPQGEAISYGGSADYWQISEGVNASIWHIGCLD